MAPLRAALARHFGGLPSAFWWLWTGAFISALATFVFPFLALFLTARGYSPARAGLVVSLYGAGIMVAGPIAGIASDRFGRRPTILSALTGAAATAGVLAFLSSPLALSAVVLLFGLSAAAVYIAIQAMVADLVPADRRPHAFGLLYWANNAGTGVSLLVGGLLASRSWALPFLADGVTSLAFAVLVWRRLPETRPALEARPRDPTPGRGFSAVLRDHRFAAFLGLQILFGAAFWQMQTSLPIDMARHGFSAAAFGPVLAVNTALITLLQPFAARVTAPYSRTTVLAAASVAAGVGFGSYTFCVSAWHYGVATGIWSLGEIAYMPNAAALVAEMAPPELRGRYAGAYSLSFGIASLVAPLVGPVTMQVFGSPALWTACLVAGVAVAGGYAALRRSLPDSNPAAIDAGPTAGPPALTH